jgi:hypothetical protein
MGGDSVKSRWSGTERQETKENAEKTYHLPLAYRLGYSSFGEGGDSQKKTRDE